MSLAINNLYILGIGAGLLSALLLGGGDYFAGDIAGKTNTYISIFMVYIIECLVMGTIVLAQGDFGYGGENFKMFLASISGNLGFIVLIYGLSKGKISVVATISGVMQLVVPLIFSLYVDKDVISTLTWVGIAIALISIFFISFAKHEDEKSKSLSFSIITGIVSGLALSVFVTGIVKIETTVSLRLLITAMPAAVAGAVYFLFKRSDFKNGMKHIVPVVLVAIAYLIGLWALSYSGHHVSLFISTLLISLIPAVTVVLAKFHKNELISRIQYFGFALAGIGVITIGLGLS